MTCEGYVLNLNMLKTTYILRDVVTELHEAIRRHPEDEWNISIVHNASYVVEEAGELLKEVNNIINNPICGSTKTTVVDKITLAKIRKEAVQTCSTALRFILWLDKHEQNIITR